MNFNLKILKVECYGWQTVLNLGIAGHVTSKKLAWKKWGGPSLNSAVWSAQAISSSEPSK